MSADYRVFLDRKSQVGSDNGFDPVFIPNFLFDFQKSLVDWAVRKGRAAIYADCGLGKTPMQLVWAENVSRKTNKRVLILTPLAVSGQTLRESEKFGIEAARCSDGNLDGLPKIIITNYQRLHYFKPSDFVGAICDESSILKNFDGATKQAVTEFLRTLSYRLLCTATAAPNDFIELGTSSEALGEMGYMDMLSRFFKHDSGSTHPGRGFFSGQWRFRGHAERDFWRWVCSWARAVRKPSDLGFDDGKFILPPLSLNQHIVKAKTRPGGFLFDLPAMTLEEQRDERRRTINERCEMAAGLTQVHRTSILWCHLNPEGDLLERLVDGGVQVSGDDSDDRKEEVFEAFSIGKIRKLITKPTIAGYGLNWQHCNHQTFFPSHSFEQWYQSVRRSWRFGQENPVTIDIVTSEGESRVMANLQRKSEAASKIFDELVSLMNNELQIHRNNPFNTKQETPSWL